MAKKGRLALSRRLLSPVSLASAELVGIFLNSLIGSYHVAALLLLLEEPAWEGSRVVILASVRSTFTHSLTYPSLCQVHVPSNTGYVRYVRKTAEETAPAPPHVPQQQQ